MSEKLKRLAKDEALVNSIFSFIQESFLKSRSNKDVYYLAAKSLSLEFLEEAKKEMLRIRDEEPKEPTQLKQVGL